MEIIKVKSKGSDGYLANDTMYVPLDTGNSQYKEIQQWIADGGIVEQEDFLQIAKDEKISQLAKNREFKAEKSIIEYNGKTYANSQNARTAINGRIGIMTNSSPARFYPTYPEKETMMLVKSDFVALANLIDENESNLRQQEKDLIDEINAIIVDGEYFDENNQPITPLQKLESININL